MYKMFLGVILLVASVNLQAAPIFVGSYQVDDGDNWITNPNVFSATEAAAFIFGGQASDYFISIDSSLDFTSITHTGWYSIWGVSGGSVFDENFSVDLGAPGYDDPGEINSAISAYVDDNARGSQYTNYVWTSDVQAVPAPAALWLIGSGLIGLVGMRKKAVKLSGKNA